MKYTHPPKYLYRYRSLRGDQRDFTRDILVNHRLYWATPSMFNDPFDCAPAPFYQISRLKREAHARALLAKQAPHLDKRERKRLAKSAMSHSATEIEAGMRGLQQQMRQEIAVCCLSAQPDHQLMWSHYADSHHGICLRFCTYDEGSPFLTALPVLYSPIRPLINMAAPSPPDLLEKVLLTKSECWSYEMEWRMLDQSSRGSGLRTFPSRFLDGIIFGASVSQEDRREVLSWIERRNHPIELFDARLDDRRYQLVIGPAATRSPEDMQHGRNMS